VIFERRPQILRKKVLHIVASAATSKGSVFGKGVSFVRRNAQYRLDKRRGRNMWYSKKGGVECGTEKKNNNPHQAGW